MLLVFERVLDGEYSAPGMAEQVEIAPVQPKRLTNLLDFLDEAGYVPEA